MRGTKTIVGIDLDYYKKIKGLAGYNGTTLSEEINNALGEYLIKNGNKK